MMPSAAIRRKKDSSISRAADMVKAGEADQARQLINSKETPAWRALKKHLLEDIERIRELTDNQRNEAAAKASEAEKLMLALAVLATLVGVISAVAMLRVDQCVASFNWVCWMASTRALMGARGSSILCDKIISSEFIPEKERMG